MSLDGNVGFIRWFFDLTIFINYMSFIYDSIIIVKNQCYEYNVGMEIPHRQSTSV